MRSVSGQRSSAQTASGDAVKIVDQMPTVRPSSSATAKSVSESPPSTASAARMNIAPRPVFTVRGPVGRNAALPLSRSRPAGAPDVCSRIRSKITIVSLTARPMIDSTAARNTPSTGLPSHAKMPTTVSTTCDIATTAAAAYVHRKRNAR